MFWVGILSPVSVKAGKIASIFSTYHRTHFLILIFNWIDPIVVLVVGFTGLDW